MHISVYPVAEAPKEWVFSPDMQWVIFIPYQLDKYVFHGDPNNPDIPAWIDALVKDFHDGPIQYYVKYIYGMGTVIGPVPKK
jgi:hypothetical protein